MRTIRAFEESCSKSAWALGLAAAMGVVSCAQPAESGDGVEVDVQRAELVVGSGSCMRDFIAQNPVLNATTDTSFFNLKMPDVFGTSLFTGGQANQSFSPGNTGDFGTWSLSSTENQDTSVPADNFGLLTCNGCHTDNKRRTDQAFYQPLETSCAMARAGARIAICVSRRSPPAEPARPAPRACHSTAKTTCARHNRTPRTSRCFASAAPDTADLRSAGVWWTAPEKREPLLRSKVVAAAAASAASVVARRAARRLLGAPPAPVTSR